MKPPSRSEFDSTRWSMIEMAGAKDGSQRRTALDKILSAYLPALHTYLMLNRRLNAEEAEDLLHDFVTDKILQGDLLSRADHTKGRFRSLLIKSLNNYLVDRYRSRQSSDPTAKGTKSLEDLGSSYPGHPKNSEADLFDAIWARTILVGAVADLRQHCEQEKREDIWKLFEERLLRPLMWDTPPTPYDQLVGELGFESAAQASNAFMTAKRQFRRALNARVAPFAHEKSVVDGEIVELKTVLASTGSLDLELPLDKTFESKTLDQAGIQRLAKLLDLNDEDPSPWSDEQLTGSLEYHLALPLTDCVGQVSPRLAAGISLMASSDVAPVVTLYDLFVHTAPPIDVLRAVKDWATQRMQNKDANTPPQIAPVIYLSAVTVALLRCDERITRSDDADLEVTLRQALGARWIAQSIRNLFKEALQQVG